MLFRPVFAGCRLQRHARDGRNGGQCFAAKSQRRNRKQIVGRAKFRSCVPLEGQQRVVAIHAVAVVGDADQLASAGLDFDTDARCAGIQRILKQLFHH